MSEGLLDQLTLEEELSPPVGAEPVAPGTTVFLAKYTIAIPAFAPRF